VSKFSHSASGNRLYFGDNLDWLPRLESNTVDLVYLDPPFNSNATYNADGGFCVP
jgi:16S rRNA G966 N2-methylase RsmD